MYLIRNNGTSIFLVEYTGCSISDGICFTDEVDTEK